MNSQAVSYYDLEISETLYSSVQLYHEILAEGISLIDQENYLPSFSLKLNESWYNYLIKIKSQSILLIILFPVSN